MNVDNPNTDSVVVAVDFSTDMTTTPRKPKRGTLLTLMDAARQGHSHFRIKMLELEAVCSGFPVTTTASEHRFQNRIAAVF